MARILVFDSGVGGLSILRAIQSHADICVTDHQWLFCSDNAFFPYGTKLEDILISRVCDVLDNVYQKYTPDIIVIACNTASTIALDAVRHKINIPIIGVVPAIKPAALASQSRSIGLLATPGTISRSYTQKLIDDFASDCTVTRVGSSELVEMAEKFLRDEKIDHQQLQQIVQPFKRAIAESELDTLVLACTHFPLLIESLKQQLPEISHWIDSGEAIARRVVWYLPQLTNQQNLSANIAIFTSRQESVEKLQHCFPQFHIEKVDYLENI